jgi:hypothetical protein
MFKKDHKKYIVGIDFGTSCSGYTFILADTKDPESKIFECNNWKDTPTRNAGANKTATALLYKGEQLIDWGFSALVAFQNMDPKDIAAQNFSIVQNFKMDLYNARRSGDTCMMKKSCRYIRDFLSCMAEKVMQDIKSATKTGNVKKSEIKWVLSIPTIWEDEEKDAMKRLVHEAQIISKDADESEFMMVLEPEAAAVFCLKKSQCKVVEGDTMLIVDCGGGTVDLSVHQVEKSVLRASRGALSQSTVHTGGPYGSIVLNGRFAELLGEIFSHDFMDAIRGDSPRAFYDLIGVQWEESKCGMNDLTTPINITPPQEFRSLMKQRGISIPEFRSVTNKLRFTAEHLAKIWNENIDNILKLVDEQLTAVGGQVDYIFIVGGLGNSPITQKAIIDGFNKHARKKVFCPPQAASSVVYGASLLGFDDSLIRIRRVNATYGVEVKENYTQRNRGKYDELHLGETDDGWAYERLFEHFVTCGQEVAVDDVVEKSFEFEVGKNHVDVIVYKAMSPDVIYTDEKYVKPLGTLKVNRPTGNGVSNEIIVKMYFGTVMIRVEVFNSSGQAINHTFDLQEV